MFEKEGLELTLGINYILLQKGTACEGNLGKKKINIIKSTQCIRMCNALSHIKHQIWIGL